ncbi:MAG: hypothetical protein K2N56_00125 [Oscillospiraceae bacterium]|nr:hypothetical protein [Oscillospiraceae bacterium]
MNMNGNKLLDKISDLDPKLIEGAEKKTHRSKRGLFVGLTSGMATVAAAAVIAVTAANTQVQQPPVVITSDPVVSGSNSGSTSTQDPPVIDNTPKDPPALDFSKYKDLPKISDITNYGNSAMGGGKTQLSVNNEELENRSPWNGKALETMPVYMSSSTETPDLDKMYARVKEIAAALGISEDKLEITDSYEDLTSSIENQIKMAEEMNAPKEEIEEVLNRMIRGTMSSVYVSANADGIKIELNTAYGAWIRFDKPIDLPEGYNFTNSATSEERAEALSYLAEKYKGLIGYSDPKPGKIEREGSNVYDTAGDITQQIVNYWINTTQFRINKDNKLDTIWIFTDAACEKLADYPILTAAQAEEILKSNKYSDLLRMPVDAKIVKTDLVYRNVPGSTAVIPYYEFYVEIDNEPNFGKDLTCDVYTIEAVPEEFIDIETVDYGAHA